MKLQNSTLLNVRNQPTPQRLDRTLRQHFPAWGRQAIQQTISQRKVSVNGKLVWLASWQVQTGDQIVIHDPPAAKLDAPEHFDARWLLADEGELLAVNKPSGLLSEPTRWGTGVNLRDLAIARFGELILFHRLDRDTSGVVLLTRPGSINQTLDKMFQSHTLEKEYVAIVHAPNRLAAQGEINLRLDTHPQRRDQMIVVERGGQHAITRYEVVERRTDRQVVRLYPKTGRTHQLRLHLAHFGAAILGDRLYGQADGAPRLMLHAHKLTLPEPINRTFTAPLPAEFALS